MTGGQWPLHCGGESFCYDAVVSGAQTDLNEAMRSVAAASRGLRLLVLHGSRARRDSHDRSDWDLAYQADSTFDPDALLAGFADLLKADRIDLVDLDRAGALLRYRAARDGIVLFQREAGGFERFWLDAVDTWCDLGPVLEPAYARVLETLPQ